MTFSKSTDNARAHNVSTLPTTSTIHDRTSRTTIQAYNLYNKSQEMQQFLKFIFGIELYMFRTGFLSIIGILVLYTQL
jgi:hypothetical protein